MKNQKIRNVIIDDGLNFSVYSELDKFLYNAENINTKVSLLTLLRHKINLDYLQIGKPAFLVNESMSSNLTKEVFKFPYNGRKEDEIKIFFSDKVCEKVLKITYKNGRILFSIKNQFIVKKKEILFSGVIIIVGVLGMPADSKSMTQSFRFRTSSLARSAQEIHRPARKQFRQCAPTPNPRVDRIVMMANSKMIPLIYVSSQHSYINEQLLKNLRAGNLPANLLVAFIGVSVFIIFQSLGIDAFSILAKLGTSRTVQPDQGRLPYPTSTQVSVVPTQASDFNRMLQEFNKPKEREVEYVMSREEALTKLTETYSSELEITDSRRVSEWQAAKKIYHAIDFGINPEDYGMSKKDVLYLNKVGLTKYAREGRTLPPIKLVNDYQKAIQTMCLNTAESNTAAGKYNSNAEQKTHDSFYYYNNENRQIVVFNTETGDLITAGKYSKNSFTRFLDSFPKSLGKL